MLQLNPNLEALIQQESVLSKIVNMAAEGQFNELLQLLPLDFQALIHSAEILEVSSRARLLALQMYL